VTDAPVLGLPVRMPGPAAELGESPVWDPTTGRLHWVDLPAGVVHATDPASGEDAALHFEQATGFVALAERGLIVGVGSTVRTVSPDGTAAVLGETDPTRMLRLNDSQVSPGGWLFGGLLAIDRERRDGTGRVIRVSPDGSVDVITEGISLTNGLGWSPDGSTMYHVDMALRRVDRYDFDRASGSATHRGVAFPLDSVDGLSDGMAVDSEGRLWIAFWGTPFVRCFTPDGIEVARVALPVANVTSCAFGGPGLSTLFVTTARRGAGPEHPDAGAVFSVVTDARGQEPRRFGVL